MKFRIEAKGKKKKQTHTAITSRLQICFPLLRLVFYFFGSKSVDQNCLHDWLGGIIIQHFMTFWENIHKYKTSI